MSNMSNGRRHPHGAMVLTKRAIADNERVQGEALRRLPGGASTESPAEVGRPGGATKSLRARGTDRRCRATMAGDVALCKHGALGWQRGEARPIGCATPQHPRAM